METVTESLERSLQNCSLDNSRNSNVGQLVTGSGETLLELNSHISLPYQWEQCLDLKTGEIYYINWSNGMKSREDPRTRADTRGDLHSQDEEDDDNDDDCSYDSEESSSESSVSSSSTNQQQKKNYDREVKEDQVLVVAGCKSCFMYYMVPKLAGVCPKCSGQLLHFDRSQNRS